MKHDLPEKLSDKEIVKRYIKSIDKGILKVMSKMGISTYQSYCGAQIFDAVGLRTDFVEQVFHRHRDSRIEGVGLAEIARRDRRTRHADAFGNSPVLRTFLEVGGEYAFRFRGEAHAWTPETVSLLQHAVRGNSYERFKEFTRARQRSVGAAARRSAACSASAARRKTAARRCRSTRSSPRRTSSSASPPAR